ncbi:MAG: hypothetical protein PHE55_15600 [Methylococcaceae bacterium]|nr:hypothetical protein [Methylococcaceae bacterium]
MSFDPKMPYNDLPLLPPPVDLESKAVLKKAIAANKALAELKGKRQINPFFSGTAGDGMMGLINFTAKEAPACSTITFTVRPIRQRPRKNTGGPIWQPRREAA